MNIVDVYVTHPENCKLNKWKVNEGQEVKQGQPIAEFRTEPNIQKFIVSKTITLLSPANGNISLVVKPGAMCTHGQVVAKITECTHGLHFGGICVYCQKDVSTSNISPMIIGAHPKLTLSHQYAAKEQETLEQRLILERKLFLILDLDLTVVHAKKSDIMYNPSDFDNEVFTIVVDKSCYAIKFRPGLKQFLTEVSNLYEIQIYTMGTRSYAQQVVTCMDKIMGRHLFQNRILTRDDYRSFTNKDLRTLFPHGGELAIIVDDREDVWAASVNNLLPIFPYLFWKGEGDINDPKLLESVKCNVTNNEHPQIVEQQQEENTNSDNTPKIKQNNGSIVEHELEVNQKIENGGDKVSISSEPVVNNKRTRLQEDNINPINKIPRLINSLDKTNTQTTTIEPPSLSEDNKLQREELIKLPTIKKKKIEKPESEMEITTTDTNINERKQETDKESDDDAEKIRIKQLKNIKEQEILFFKQEEILRNDKDTLIELVRNDLDNHLVSILGILKKVHNEFYNYYDQNKKIYDVKPILQKIKKNTLAGCHILFSGIIQRGTYPEENHPMWRRTLLYGAKCYHDCDSKVTHLVARRGGTDKIKKAIKDKANLYLVNLDWLVQSTFLCSRQDERHFPVKDEHIDPDKDNPKTYPVIIGEEPEIKPDEEETNEEETNEKNDDISEEEEINEEDLKRLEDEIREQESLYHDEDSIEFEKEIERELDKEESNDYDLNQYYDFDYSNDESSD